MKEGKKICIAKTFRFPPEIADAIKRRAECYKCTKTDYLKYLILKDCESDYSAESFATYRLQELSSKMDKLKFIIDEFGNLFLEFLAVYLIKNDYPKFEELNDMEEGADSKLNEMLRHHINEFKIGNKDFLGNLFDMLIDEEDEDLERPELQFKVMERMECRFMQVVVEGGYK